MEQQTDDRAYVLFLPNPISRYAVNKAVELIPYMIGTLILTETRVATWGSTVQPNNRVQATAASISCASAASRA